jgi:hypothetical protein
MTNRVRDCPAGKRLQLLDCCLRHDSQRGWKLRGFLATVQKFNVLLQAKRLGLFLGFKERPDPFPAFFVVHDKLQVRPFAVAILANFMLPHVPMLPSVATFSSKFALFCVFMCYNESMLKDMVFIVENAISEGKTAG